MTGGTIWKAVCAAAMLAPGVALAAAAPATANVVTLQPLSIVKTDDLDFGSLIAGAAAGTAVINANTDARTTTGGVTAAGGAPSAAHFATAGRASFVAFITLPGGMTLTRGAGPQTMTVTAITSNGPNFRLFPGSAAFDIAVGGTLNVAANQASGTYTGTFNVTVDYF